MQTIVELPEYAKRSDKLLNESESNSIINYLAAHPAAGKLMQGTGGIRKLRWSSQGRGKSSGVRVIYYFHSGIMPLYLLTVFGKNEKSNISSEEKNLLSKIVKKLVVFWRQKNEQSIH